MYHPFLRFIIPLVLLLAIVAVWGDHRRRDTASRSHPHHPVHHPRSHMTAAGILALVLVVSFIASFLIP